jgi:glycerol-3-phosphate dehydrogenase
MKRNLSELTNTVYDLLVVGGGIYGACVAWDAALRGLRVGLIEKSDFGSATSANSLKIIHGGLRYLQYGDFRRMRQYIRERSTWMRIAPHLIHPLPVVVPIYGRCGWSKQFLSLALRLNDAIGFDRNRAANPEQFIPPGKVVSKSECLQLVPGLTQQDLAGGMVFHDAQVYNTERLLLSIIRAADQAGATLVNYVEMTGFLRSGSQVRGIEAKDVLTGDCFEIQASSVVNTCGPWLGRLLGLPDGSPPAGHYAAAMNLVTRSLSEKYAFGIFAANGYEDPNTLIPKKSSLLFITPWRNRSIIGTRYRRYQGVPDEFRVTEKDIREFIGDVRSAYPGADLEFKDVTFVHGGLLPCTQTSGRAGTVDLLKKHQIIDHRSQGLNGVLSVVGVKYTMARFVAEKVVDRLFETRSQKAPRTRTTVTPVYGGDMDRVESSVRAAINGETRRLNEKSIRRLIHTYGSKYFQVLQHIAFGGPQGGNEELAVLKAEVLHAVHDEMAQKLSDVVFRRTDLGSAGHPGNEALRVCVETMGAELGWGPERSRTELDEISCALHIGGNNRIAA